MNRPEYIHCIADQHQGNIGKALCGREIGWAKTVKVNDPHIGEMLVKELKATEFCFQSVDHWFLNACAEGRLQGCKKCLKQVEEMIKRER
jgi:hypothetical protein